MARTKAGKPKPKKTLRTLSTKVIGAGPAASVRGGKLFCATGKHIARPHF